MPSEPRHGTRLRSGGPLNRSGSCARRSASSGSTSDSPCPPSSRSRNLATARSCASANPPVPPGGSTRSKQLKRGWAHSSRSNHALCTWGTRGMRSSKPACFSRTLSNDRATYAACPSGVPRTVMPCVPGARVQLPTQASARAAARRRWLDARRSRVCAGCSCRPSSCYGWFRASTRLRGSLPRLTGRGGQSALADVARLR